MTDGEGPPHRPSVKLDAVTFEREFQHWLRTRGTIYHLDLTDEQIERIVEHAARSRGVTG